MNRAQEDTKTLDCLRSGVDCMTAWRVWAWIPGMVIDRS